jgi:hypothetical protein
MPAKAPLPPPLYLKLLSISLHDKKAIMRVLRPNKAGIFGGNATVIKGTIKGGED